MMTTFLPLSDNSGLPAATGQYLRGLGFEDTVWGEPSATLFDTTSAYEPGNAARHFGSSYHVLEHVRPDIARLARFAHHIEVATFHMCAAFEQAGVNDFVYDLEAGRPRRRTNATWFTILAATTFTRFQVLRRALTYHWTPPAEVEPLTYSAFFSLCELTPEAALHLKQLFPLRRRRAIEGLVDQLDLVARGLENVVELAADANAVIHDGSEEEAATQLAASQAEVLAKAGDALGLREAAERLGMSRQNLHKRIAAGSALGVMRDRQLVIPSVQFVVEDGQEKIVADLRPIVSAFVDAKAGHWSALQFLVDLDPLLGDTPMTILKAGASDAVVHAARAHLGLDER